MQINPCQCMTSEGKPCTRNGSLEPGENPLFCWQHQKCKNLLKSEIIHRDNTPKSYSTEKAQRKLNRLYDCIQLQHTQIMEQSGIEKNKIHIKWQLVDGNFRVLQHHFDGTNYMFIVAMYYDDDSKKHLCNLYLNNTANNIISIRSENYAHAKEKKYYAIEPELIKKYCIELMEKYNKKTDKVELWINYIQNCSWCRLLNIPNNTCYGLGGIFGLLYSVLSKIDYDGDVYLEDDSQFLANCNVVGQGLPSIPLRLLGGKKSIYESYGFVPVNDNDIRVSYNEFVNDIINNLFIWNFGYGEIEATPYEIVQSYFKNNIKEKDRYDYDVFVQTLYKFNHSAKKIGPMYKIRKILERMICTNYTLWKCKEKK